jgi:hypothetical protein
MNKIYNALADFQQECPVIIKKRDRNAFEVNSDSAVLALIFLNKNVVKSYHNIG